MAKITLSLDELLKILISNGLLPREIIRARVQGERIHFVIRTDSFVLPYIPASLRYLSFENNTLVLGITIVSGHLNKAVRWLNQLLKVKVPACMKLEYPNVFIDIEKLLEGKNIRGVRVKDIHFEDGEVAIVTGNGC